MSLLRSNLAHMAGGFFLMGSWALVANLSHPLPAPILAGITQGTMTALITVGLKRMTETMAQYFPGRNGLILSPLVACLISVVLLFTIHSAAQTPEVWATLALPSTIATLYTALYAYRLRKTP